MISFLTFDNLKKNENWLIYEYTTGYAPRGLLVHLGRGAIKFDNLIFYLKRKSKKIY